jgi:hypothetical protein
VKVLEHHVLNRRFEGEPFHYASSSQSVFVMLLLAMSTTVIDRQ